MPFDGRKRDFDDIHIDGPESATQFGALAGQQHRAVGLAGGKFQQLFKSRLVYGNPGTAEAFAESVLPVLPCYVLDLVNGSPRNRRTGTRVLCALSSLLASRTPRRRCSSLSSARTAA